MEIQVHIKDIHYGMGGENGKCAGRGIIVSGGVANGAKTMTPLDMHLHSECTFIVSRGFAAVQSYDPPS